MKKNYREALLKAQNQITTNPNMFRDPRNTPSRPTISGCMDPNALNYDPNANLACADCCQKRIRHIDETCPQQPCPSLDMEWDPNLCTCVPRRVPAVRDPNNPFGPNVGIRPFKTGGQIGS
jgi:hypothetical protein